MVRFLKSSSMTDQSHPWDSSSCDSSSRATTTKTKTNRTNVAQLFDRITAAEASKSILFPNGEGGSSNTTTTTPTHITNNNRTDNTNAFQNDRSIPKLTAVRAANNELVVEDSSNSTIVDDCASDSVASFYNQLMQTWEQTDKVLTQDIPIAVSTTLHHTHQQIRDSINDSFTSSSSSIIGHISSIASIFFISCSTISFCWTDRSSSSPVKSNVFEIKVSKFWVALCWTSSSLAEIS